MRRILVTMTALALALGACGGDDDDGLAQTVTTTSTTSTTPSAPAERAGDEPSTTTTAAPGPRDPQAILLKLEELPTGWTTSPPDEEDDGTSDMDCFAEAAGEDFDDQADAEVAFQQSDFGPFIGASVTVEESGDAAQERVDLFATGMQACDGYTETDEDGNETTWTVSPLSFPDLGDGTFAARMGTTTFMGPMNVDIVVTRVDEVIVFTAHMSIGAADSELTERVQRLQVDRV